MAGVTPAARVLARVRAAAAPNARVELYGSSVYAPAHASDVDVAVADDDPHRLAAALGLAVIPTTPPRLVGTLDDIAVDISIGDDPTGPRDARALVAYLGARDPVFQALWPHVRRFVRARALGHNGLGWFGSFGWALLLAVPVVTAGVERFAPWLRWLATLGPNTRVELAGVRPGPFFLAAPSAPPRDVAGLSRRAAGWLFAEASAAAAATAGVDDDAAASARVGDLADAPPPGTTLAVTGDDERGRGRYDGVARGLIRELETLGPVRSWGRFDHDADGWTHRITVPTHKVDAARRAIEHALAVHAIDAHIL